MVDVCLGVIMTLVSCAVCFVIEKRCSNLLIEKEREIIELKNNFKIYQTATEMELKFYKTTVEEQERK